MDNGYVIPNLDEDWTFAGCKVLEWVAGLATAMVITEIFVESTAQSMPILLVIGIGTPLLLSALRRQFPDQERGIRNLVMTSLGIPPPGIPRPAPLQPEWSGAPLRELGEDKEFTQLGLQQVFKCASPEDEDDAP